jgi:hypothetical protein
MKPMIRSARIALAVLALCATALPAAAAQPAAPSLEVMRAMSGTWTALGRAPQQQGKAAPAPAPELPVSTINDRRFPPALEALLRPWAKAGYDKYKDAASKVVDKEPPTPDNNCLPFSMPGESVSINFPMYFHITPKTVGILMQIDTQMRLIHMDAQHPANLKPSMHGDSVGHWEGDTLVVDTIGFDDRAQFNDGIIHSPKLQVTERYRVIDAGATLEKTFTFTDPDAFTGPYTIVRLSHRADRPFQEYMNAQNNTLYECPTAAAGTRYQPFR